MDNQQLTEAIKMYAEIDEQIKDLTTQKEALRSVFKELVKDEGEISLAGYKLALRTRKTYKYPKEVTELEKQLTTMKKLAENSTYIEFEVSEVLVIKKVS
jgi:helix-turn-helix protein